MHSADLLRAQASPNNFLQRAVRCPAPSSALPSGVSDRARAVAPAARLAKRDIVKDGTTTLHSCQRKCRSRPKVCDVTVQQTTPLNFTAAPNKTSLYTYSLYGIGSVLRNSHRRRRLDFFWVLTVYVISFVVNVKHRTTQEMIALFLLRLKI